MVSSMFRQNTTTGARMMMLSSMSTTAAATSSSPSSSRGVRSKTGGAATVRVWVLLACVLSSAAPPSILFVVVPPCSAAKPDLQARFLYSNDPTNVVPAEERRRGQPELDHPQGSYVLEYVSNATSRVDQQADKPGFLYSNNPVQGYRIVNYYVDYCATCKALVPYYIQFAKYIYQKQKQHELHPKYKISVYAVSCMVNKPLCQGQKVLGFPMIRLYKPGQIGTDGYDLHYRNLNPLYVFKYFGIENEAASSEDMEMIDWELERHLLPSQQQQMISNQKQENLSNQMGLFDRILASVGLQRRSMIGNNNMDVALYSYHSRWTKYGTRTYEELQNDVHMAFDFVLRNGAFVTSDKLDDARKSALKQWILLLDKVLPPSWTRMHDLIDELKGNILYATRSEHYLLSYLDRYPPLKDAWSGTCSRGGAESNGYKCGLWSFFHVATISVVEFNELVPPAARYAPAAVADMIRDFLQHFFLCRSCVENFIEDYDACGHNRCNRLTTTATDNIEDWKQLPLWLWEVHNAVSMEVLRRSKRASIEIESGTDTDNTERMTNGTEHDSENNIIGDGGGGLPTLLEEIDSTWPSREQCYQCYKQVGQFDPDHVYKYLQLEYGRRDAIPNPRQVLQDLRKPNVDLYSSSMMASSQFDYYPGQLQHDDTNHSVLLVIFFLFGLFGGAIYRYFGSISIRLLVRRFSGKGKGKCSTDANEKDD